MRPIQIPITLRFPFITHQPEIQKLKTAYLGEGTLNGYRPFGGQFNHQSIYQKCKSTYP